MYRRCSTPSMSSPSDRPLVPGRCRPCEGPSGVVVGHAVDRDDSRLRLRAVERTGRCTRARRQRVGFPSCGQLWSAVEGLDWRSRVDDEWPGTAEFVTRCACPSSARPREGRSSGVCPAPNYEAIDAGDLDIRSADASSRTRIRNIDAAPAAPRSGALARRRARIRHLVDGAEDTLAARQPLEQTEQRLAPIASIGLHPGHGRAGCPVE